ncbi:MAG: glycosyltransferase [Bacteroidota bacterium]|nr:glycosyltransferase [Bacteroidota bacterium]
MKVLFLARNNLLTNPGGDTTQILATREELVKRGVEVRLELVSDGQCTLPRSMLKAFDLVHAFNLLLVHQYRSSLREARSEGIPVVLSPIYWDMETYEERGGAVALWKKAILFLARQLNGPRIAKLLERRLKSVHYNPYFRRCLSNVLANADLILPNSMIEAEMLRERFGTQSPMLIVRNGCRFLDGEMNLPDGVPAEYILCVGRIERRKNQRTLIRAMEGIDMPLILLGNVNMAERAYWSQCQFESRKFRVRLYHYGGRPWEETWPFFASARIHAQPSWFETPGLTSLEAAAAGCRIVCTQYGSASEYFGDEAIYCDPASVQSVRDALMRALSDTRPTTPLRERVRARYTWSATAEQTIRAYRTLIRNYEQIPALTDAFV